MVKKYLKLSDQDIKLNDKLKQKEIEDLNLAGGEGSEEDAGWESLSTADKNMLFEAFKEMKKKQIAESKEDKTSEEEGEVEKPKSKSIKKKKSEEE